MTPDRAHWDAFVADVLKLAHDAGFDGVGLGAFTLHPEDASTTVYTAVLCAPDTSLAQCALGIRSIADRLMSARPGAPPAVVAQA